MCIVKVRVRTAWFRLDAAGSGTGWHGEVVGCTCREAMEAKEPTQWETRDREVGNRARVGDQGRKGRRQVTSDTQHKQEATKGR